MRAVDLSPPETVLFRDKNGDGAMGMGNDSSYVSAPPVSLCIAIMRAAALFDRNNPFCSPFCSASKVGIGVPGVETGYMNGPSGYTSVFDARRLLGCIFS